MIKYWWSCRWRPCGRQGGLVSELLQGDSEPSLPLHINQKTSEWLNQYHSKDVGLKDLRFVSWNFVLKDLDEFWTPQTRGEILQRKSWGGFHQNHVNYFLITTSRSQEGFQHNVTVRYFDRSIYCRPAHRRLSLQFCSSGFRPEILSTITWRGSRTKKQFTSPKKGKFGEQRTLVKVSQNVHRMFYI